MPRITSKNYKRAQELLEKAKSDPNTDPTRLNNLEMSLNSFYENASPEDLGQTPAATEPAAARREGVAGYFYEPSVEEFRAGIKDRAVRERIGLSDTYSSGKTAGQSYLESKVPALSGMSKTDIEGLGEHSDEYKRYSDYAYQEALKKDPNLSRYSDLDVTKNPFKKALGAAVKYGPAAALGAERTLTLGGMKGALAEAMVNSPSEPGSRAAKVDRVAQSESQNQADQSAKRTVLETAKTLESLSPGANAVGQMAGYLVPGAPANVAARELQAGLGYAARNPFTKAGIGSLVGGSVATGEGALQDISENPQISGEELLSNAVPRAVFGAGGGALGDLIAQGAGKTQTAFEESPRWAGIKNQKDIGGGTNFITGIQTSPAVRENIREANLGRANKTAQDIAAQKIAPKLQESVEGKFKTTAAKINKQVEDYVKSPEGQAEHSAKPAVKRLLDFAGKGTVSMPASGRVVSANRQSADAVRKYIQEFSEMQHVSPQEAQLYAQKHDGIVLDNRQADILGLPSQQGKVHVVIPGRFNAEALLKKEDDLARRLKYDAKEGGIDNPVLKELDKSFHEIRDQFQYYPEGSKGMSSVSDNATGIQGPSSVGADPTELAATGVTDTAYNDIGEDDFVQSSVKPTPIRREPAPGDYQTPEVVNQGYNENNPEGPWKSMDPEVEYHLGETNYFQHMDSQAEDADRYGKLLNEFSEYKPSDNYVDDTLAFNKREAREADATRRAQKAQADAERAAEKNIPPLPAPQHLEEAVSPTVAQEVPIPLYEQRKRDLEKYMQTHEGHITKQIAGQKMGWDQKPEWQIDQLVKEGKLEQVPPGEKKFGQIDIEYRVPKNKPEAISSQPKSPREVIENLGGVGKRIRIADIRKAFPNMSREELDNMMMKMQDSGEAALYKFDNPADLKPEDVAGAMDVAGNPRHALYLDPRYKKPAEVVPPPLPSNPPTSVTEIPSSIEDLPAEEAFSLHPSRFAEPEITNQSSAGAESMIDAGLLRNQIADQAKLEGIPNPLADRSGELTATLDDGTQVYGFSALRRQQHQALKELEDAQSAAGLGSKEGAHRHVLDYKTGEGRLFSNEELANQADEIGLRQQLEEVPATREYPGLRARTGFGGGEGPINTIKDVVGFRLDPVMGAIAGTPPNPYAPPQNTAVGRIKQYLFRQGVPFHPLLEQKGGLGAARFGNDIADEYEEMKNRNQY